MAHEDRCVNTANPDAHDRAENSETMEQVERALAGLPEGQREAFVLTKVYQNEKSR